MTLRSITAAAVALVMSVATGVADPWPIRPVTMVVPFTAGTTSDIIARALVDHLGRAIGQPVVIDNRGGAGGNIPARGHIGRHQVAAGIIRTPLELAECRCADSQREEHR